MFGIGKKGLTGKVLFVDDLEGSISFVRILEKKGLKSNGLEMPELY